MSRTLATTTLAALLALAACTGSDAPTGSDPDTVPTTENSVPTTDGSVPPLDGELCIAHDRLFLVDAAVANQIDQGVLGDSTRLGADDLVRQLGVSDDEIDDSEIVRQSVEQILGAFAVYDSDDPVGVAAKVVEDQQAPVASPVHAVGYAGHWRFAPGTEASKAEGEVPEEPDADAEIGVIVIDTGYVESRHPLLAERVRPLVAGIDDEPAGLSANLKGHGMFAASVFLQHAGSEAVVIALHPTKAGAMVDHGDSIDFGDRLSDELQLLYAMTRVTNGLEPQFDEYILNLSAGTYACDGFEPIGTRRAVDQWNDSGLGQHFVAASGNDGRRDCVFYPAAFEDVIGVGAIDDAGNRATFSNNSNVDGLGVDVLGVAPGHASGPEVRWSGTSFAAPFVAGELALGSAPAETAPSDDCS